MIHETRAHLAEYKAVNANGKIIAVVPQALACETVSHCSPMYPSAWSHLFKLCTSPPYAHLAHAAQAEATRC